MVNVFGGLPQQAPPPQQQGTQPDDVKTAIEQLIAQQQANEPHPRPPTPEEGEQIKQLGLKMMQQKGAQPSSSSGGAAFMGQGGMNPAIAQQQVPPSPSNAPASPQEPSQQGPQLPQQLQGAFFPPSGGSTGYYPPSPKMADRANKANTTAAGVLSDAAGPIERGLSNFAKSDLDQPAKEKAKPKGPDAANSALDGLISQGQQGEEAGEPKGMSEEDEGEQLKGQYGTPEHETHLAQVVAPEARKVAESLISSGVDSPEKADIALRAKLHDDPDLEKAIAEARATYDQLRQLNNQPPSVMQYIGAILLGMAGASPHVISNILHPGQALNAQREGMAGESLLKLQLAKAANHGRQIDIQAKQGEDSMAQKRLDQQMSIFQQKEGQQNTLAQQKEMRAALEKARDNASTMARHYADLASKSVGNEKKKNLDLAEQYRQHAEGFGGMLGEPSLNSMKQMQQKPPPGKPTTMAPPQQQVSPSAMRLLGIGNA